MSHTPEQSSEESLDAEIEEMLSELKPGSVSTPTSFCIVEDAEEEHRCTTFYYPRGRLMFDEDGRIFIDISTYDDSGMGTGVAFFEPSHPDYEFWVWATNERPKRAVGHYDIEKLKTEFRNKT